ncbi:MAG TPA: hypothetical protein VG652_01770 [Gaiellaceae bacterium]|nr:hypothetical protein [Gaiellaceae bacterium]
MRRIVHAAVVVSILVLPPAASAVGPSLGAIDGNPGVQGLTQDVSYSAVLTGDNTKLRAQKDGELVRSAIVPGLWGVPMVTLNGGTGGLSPNGRVLVLSDNIQPGAALRSKSGFAVVDTRTLRVTRTISLPGDYSFDALSPRGQTLFLIHHVSQSDVTKYQVRAYDLKTGALLSRVIADKRQAGWVMAGMPVTRATSSNGRWVYTLYQQSRNVPFVHALDTVSKTAVCIGLPWNWAANNAGISEATLRLVGDQLHIVGGQGSTTRFLLDTKTFRIAT